MRTQKATLGNILTEKEIELLKGSFIFFGITPDLVIRDLHFSQIENLGLLFIKTYHNGICPGGALVVIGTQEITRRMVKNDVPFEYVTFPNNDEV